MKGLKHIIGYAIIGTYILTMMSFVNMAYNKTYCTAIDISINDSISTRFVQTSDIGNILKENKFELLTKRPSEINLDSLERLVNKHSSIKDCECYFLSNGTIRIKVDQRHPIARVLTDNYNFYLDEDGRKMPTSRFYTAHVPIITGAIKMECLPDLYLIITSLQKDPFWSAQIEQVIVLKNEEYALIPRAGRHTIELGDATNLETKFESLKALYLQIFNNNSWNKYKTISVKFDGQIVCTKK